jgi:signal transduction histidine kinase
MMSTITRDLASPKVPKEFDSIALLHQAFPQLNATEVYALSEAVTHHTYKPGTNLCVEGDVGTVLYILAQGKVDVIVNTGDGPGVYVDTIEPSAYFGEMALFGESTRMATIRTRTVCQVLEIEHTDFMQVTQNNPEFLRMLLRQIIGHVRSNDRAVIRELNEKNVALQQAYADLAEQEELRSQFIATLSHELRTPLTSIQGFLGLVNQGAIKGNSLPVALGSITRNVDKMVGLLNNLLILYELHPGAMEHEYLNLMDVLVAALNLMRETGSVDLTAVDLDITSHLTIIYADKRTLVLAIRALLENAYKFTPQLPQIQVQVYQANDKEVAIAVKDQGIGIPKEEFENIFEPFYRLEREGTTHLFPGLGIGLTIARFIVERHNGRIELESTVGEGSAFTIYLPVHYNKA